MNSSNSKTYFQDVIDYKILNEVEERSQVSGPSQYFFIETTTGQISLKKSVEGTSLTAFVVCYTVKWVGLYLPLF